MKTQEMIEINGQFYPTIRELTPEEEAEMRSHEDGRENALRRIAELKGLLADSDYKAIKYAEGLISDADYAEIKAQRQAWRAEINELEGMIG